MRSERGFTLVETMVALAVTAVMLAALATGVPATLRANAVATGKLEQATATRSLLLHLERELATARPESFLLATTPAAHLEFTGGADPGQRLDYRVEGGALVRRTTPRFALPDAPARGVRVLDGVAAVQLEAFDGRDWVAVWQASTPPGAVRIRIRFADGESLGTVATIPIARGSAS